jgi:hypothetical protein
MGNSKTVAQPPPEQRLAQIVSKNQVAYSRRFANKVERMIERKPAWHSQRVKEKNAAAIAKGRKNIERRQLGREFPTNPDFEGFQRSEEKSQNWIQIVKLLK